jgi:hypothetical protein
VQHICGFVYFCAKYKIYTMKNVKTILLALAMLVAATSCQNDPKAANEQGTVNTTETIQTKPADAIFDIPAAKITYSLKGNESGVVNFYFDNYGKRWVRDANTKLMGKINRQEMRFWDGEKQVVFDRNPKNNSYKLASQDTTNNNRATYFADFARMDIKQVLDRGNFKQLGEVSIAGQTTTVLYAQNSQQQYNLWNSITLKMSYPGNSYEATSIEMIDEIPAELLQLPEGFQFQK